MKIVLSVKDENFEYKNACLYKLSYENSYKKLNNCMPIKYVYSQGEVLDFSLADIYVLPLAEHICVTAYDKALNIIDENFVEPERKCISLPENPDVRIALISDLHTIEKGKSKKMLFEAFTAVKENKADFIISAGDNTNGCQQGEFEILHSSIENHLGDIPFYSALGNHDYFANDCSETACDEARIDFFENMLSQGEVTGRHKFGSYSVRIKGIQLIFLDCIAGNEKFTFDEELAEWLENELKKSNNDRFRIIVNHLPLAAHNLGCRNKNTAFMAGNSKLQSIIDNSRNIIYVSGHTHNRIDSDYPSAEQDENGNVYLNAGSVGNTQPCLNDTKKLKPLRDLLPKDSEEYKEINRYFKTASMGLFLDVYNEHMTVQGYDFSQKKYIPRCSFVFCV